MAPHDGRDQARQRLTLGALGVDYLQIGPSPRYTKRECFRAPHGLTPTQPKIRGIQTQLVW
jgi:K+ transporter